MRKVERVKLKWLETVKKQVMRVFEAMVLSGKNYADLVVDMTGILVSS